MSHFRNSLQLRLDGSDSCARHFSDGERQDLGLSLNYDCPTPCFDENRADYVQRMVEVGGLQLRDFDPSPPVPPLPPILHSLELDGRAIPTPFLQLGAIALKYAAVGGVKSVDALLLGEFRQRHGIDPYTHIVLHGECNDEAQEELFAACGSTGFFDNLSVLHPVVCLSPAFSVYTDGKQCQLAGKYNLRRSFFIGQMLAACGLTTIVGFCAGGPRDCERVGEWVGRQGPNATHLALNAQTRNRVARAVARDALSVERVAGRELHWLVFGPCTIRSFKDVYARLGPERVTFVTSTAWHKVMSGRGPHNALLPNMPPDELAALWIAHIERERRLALEVCTLRNAS